MTGLTILLILVLTLIVMATVYGFKNYIGLDFIVEINMFSSPYYQLGVSFFGDDDGPLLREKLSIGLIFFNLVFHFYKHKE